MSESEAQDKQAGFGDALFGTRLGEAKDAATAVPPPDGLPPNDDWHPAAAPSLDAIQADSEKQELPEQERLFRIAPRVRSKLHNLPDPTRPPLGFVNGRGFDVVFPFIKLPDLTPNLNGDWVQFGSPHLEPNRLYYGDNLDVLRKYIREGTVDLCYIDPPFNSKRTYNQIYNNRGDNG